MKIVKCIRDIYDECKPLYEALASEVKELLKPQVEDKGWFFLCRLKALESFALKIETGRVPRPSKMEDFFGCTIVVPTMAQIEEAERMALSIYDQVARRPSEDTKTHKEASSFAFDDLRLYVARRSLASGKGAELDGAVFEIQVKTILQHAWSVATHDLIYKSDTVSWPRERIAFQVKAMLEHAEIAIAEANRLADAPAVAKKDAKTAGILQIIRSINEIWSRDRLPADLKRLAVTLQDLLRSCDLSAEDFPDLIREEKKRLGLLPADLSPYALTVQALAHSKAVDLQQKLKRSHNRTKIVVHGGMELPDWMKDEHPRIIKVDSINSETEGLS